METITVDNTLLDVVESETGEEVPGTEIILNPHKFSYKLNGGSE